jgi:hypothetical protein
MRMQGLRRSELLLRFAFVALLALGATPGIPGFDAVLSLAGAREVGLQTGDLLEQPASPDRHARPEQTTTDLIAAQSLRTVGRHAVRSVVLPKVGVEPLGSPPPGFGISAGPGSLLQSPAALIGLVLLAALGLRTARELRAPPIA